MAHRRRHPRIAETADLSATLRPAEQPAFFDGRVVDLSERGMLIAGGGLEVGQSVGIELAGPSFRLAGRAEVVHCNGRTTGLRVLSWSGPADRVICALIAARLRVTPGSRFRRLPRTRRPLTSSPAAAARLARDPLRAFSASILENSDHNAAHAACVGSALPGALAVPLMVVADAPEVAGAASPDDTTRPSPDSQERLREALDALPDGVAILSSIRDRSGRITDFRYEYANEALSGRRGLGPQQLIGRQLLEVFPAEIESGLFADCCELVESEELLAEKQVAFREEFGVRRIGVGLDLHAVKLGDGVVLVSTPIIAQTQTDAVNAQLAAIIDSCEDAVISVTLDGRVESWNRGAERLYGHAAEDAIGRHLGFVTGPGGEDEISAILERVGRGERVDHFESVRHSKDRGPVEVAITVSPVVNSSGRVIGASSVSCDVSDRRHADESNARLAALVNSADDAMSSVSLDGQVVSWNRGAERLYGYAAEDAIGRHFGFVSGPGREDEFPMILERVGRGERIEHYETVHRRSDERVIDVSITVSPIVNSSGTVIGASAVARDVTERNRAEAELREAQELFHRVFDEAPIGMAMLDLERRFTDVNDALCAITGYSREQLKATDPEAITHHDDLGKHGQELADLIAGDTDGFRCEKRFVHARRAPVWVTIQMTVLRDADAHPLRLIAQIQDITDRRSSDERLVYLADHDPLTGLLNRRSFERELEAHGKRSARYGGGGAAIMLDLDHFKFINDTLGHHAGDEALIRTSRVLASRLRESDVLARLGGDEFAVLLPRANSSTARLVAEELLGALRAETVDLGPHARPLAASAGIALFVSADALSAEDVLVNADLAMYDAKNAGRDRAEIFAASDRGSSRMKGRLTWAQRIGGALQHDGFTLLAQPIVELATGRTSRHELLLRMRDEHGEHVLPGSFLHVAERLEMVQEIDRWVTTQAINLLAEHRDRGEELTLDVNLSGLSIGDPALLALVSSALERSRVSPRRLTFEVTETAAVINMPRAGEFIRDLNRLGCRFALDDFGAGYGSFYYLKHLPFDFLKIDGEFVTNCRTSETDRLLIKAAVDIAAGMGKRTIAECVGDQETVRLLANLGVDYAQGFHLGHPEPLKRGTQPGAPRRRATAEAGIGSASLGQTTAKDGTAEVPMAAADGVPE
jgi:diguanylate cyclase (GGDEF)-like protein/PAS domain S-box-containing protein